MIKIIRMIGAIALAAACGACWPSIYEPTGTQYIHRSDTITLSAGNAKDINAATHVIDPWPRRVANRRIPANGERMAHAVDRYKSGQTQSSGQGGGTQVIGIPVGSATPAQSSGGSGTQ
jgi:hypothetical protein